MANTTAAAIRPKANKESLWSQIAKNGAVYLFISPFFILYAIFGVYPMIDSIVLSLLKWDGVGEKRFAGMQNYALLMKDHDFWLSLYNTLVIWVENTIPMIIMALILAFLLNAKFVKGKTFFRVVYFLPNVTSVVGVAIIFATLFGSQYGLINFVLKTIGLKSIPWLDVGWGIHFAVASLVTWRWVGYNSILALAGLQKIPESLYEAATIDGANNRQIFFKITLPLLNPVIIFIVLTSTIGGMQIFAESQVLLNNGYGTGNAGLTVVCYLYQQAFQNRQFGYGSAVAWMLFLIIMVFSLINFMITRRKED